MWSLAPTHSNVRTKLRLLSIYDARPLKALIIYSAGAMASLMKCPHCHKEIPDEAIAKHLASKGGRSTSKAKLEAARRNAKLGGAKGGRPRKKA